MATYGEGDPTDNAQDFYEWLQNDRDDLDCVNYAVSNKIIKMLSKLISIINYIIINMLISLLSHA